MGGVSLSATDLILRTKREKPRRSVRQLIALLERAGKVEHGVLTRSTVHRVLRAAGLSSRLGRDDDEKRERRSFLPERAGDVWLGDAMHGPLVVHDGRLMKTYLLTQLDGATRFIPHSRFHLSEGAVEHEHGLREGFMRHELPRTYYVDQGAAYTADSLRLICAELGVRLLHTMATTPRSPLRSSRPTASILAPTATTSSLIDHDLKAAGATTKLLSDPALEMLWRCSRGVPRTASKLLRTSLAIAHERDLTSSTDDTMIAAVDELAIAQPNAATSTTPRPQPPTPKPAPKPRAQTGTRSRK